MNTSTTNTSIQPTKISKSNRITRTEIRLQYVGSDAENGIKKGDYTPKIYTTDHAGMCAQRLHNANYDPSVDLVRVEITATEILRPSNWMELREQAEVAARAEATKAKEAEATKAAKAEKKTATANAS